MRSSQRLKGVRVRVTASLNRLRRHSLLNQKLSLLSFLALSLLFLYCLLCLGLPSHWSTDDHEPPHSGFESSPTGNATYDIVDLNGMVLDFASSVTHTSLLHSKVMLTASDVLPFLHDMHLPLVLSWREKNRLLSQVHNSALPFPPEVMKFVSEDLRRVYFPNAKGFHMKAPQPNQPLANWTTVDDLKRAVTLFQDPSSSDRYMSSIVDILVNTGVEKVVVGSSIRYALAPPLLLHLPPPAVPIFTEYALLNNPLLKASSVRAAQRRWAEYMKAVDTATTQLLGDSAPDSPPSVPRRFIVATTDRDETPTSGFIFNEKSSPHMTPNDFVHSLLDHPLLVHWYSQNCNIKVHSKASCVPIGLTFGKRSRWDAINPVPMLDQQNEIMWSWFVPRAVCNGGGNESPESRFTMNGALRHPADNLQVLLERATGTEAGAGDAALLFAWMKRYTRTRPARSNYTEVGCGGEPCTMVSEDIVEVELLDSVLNEWNLKSSGSVKWVPIESIGDYVKERYGADVLLIVRLVAPRLSVQAGIGGPKSSNVSKKSCEEGRWSDPASPPMWCQMHCIGVAMVKDNRQLELLVPVPAVFFLGLHHFRPVASQKYREMRITAAFTSDDREARRGVVKLLQTNLGDAHVDVCLGP